MDGAQRPLPSRRGFLQSTLTAAVGGLGLLSSTNAARGSSPGSYRLKLSLAAYSFNRLLRDKKYSLNQFIDLCKELNLEGAELTSYYFEGNDEAYFRGLKLKCYRAGLDISGTSINNNFAQPDPAARRKEIEAVKAWIDRADVLGAPVMRIFGGRPLEKGYTEKNAFDDVIPAMKECSEYAERKGVLLAIENHGFPLTAEQLVRIVQEVKSPCLGACLDTGRAPYEGMEVLAPLAFMVQIKPFVRTAAQISQSENEERGPREPVDLARVNRILKTSGYRGYVTLEYSGGSSSGEPDPFKEVPQWMDRMRQAFA